MNAFVTGATGLLGNNLVRALRAEGHTVRALVRSEAKGRELLAGTGAELVRGDMADVAGFAGALAGCDVLFHTAAYFRESFGAGDHWPRLEAINVGGTLALAEAARAHGVERMIDTSSSGTIGVKPDGSGGDEQTPPTRHAQANLYLRSKLIVADRLPPLAARIGLDLVQVLPGWMFGPWDAGPTGSGRLVRDFLAGALPAIPPGGASTVDARDVAAGMLRAATHARAGERYILGGLFVTLGDIIGTLAHVTKLPPPRRHIPYPVALTYAAVAQAWARLTRGETLITLEAVRLMQARLRVSSEKAEQNLGWRARPLTETLRDEVAWYRGRDAAMAKAKAAAA